MLMMPDPTAPVPGTGLALRAQRLGRAACIALPAAMLAILLLRPSTNSDMFWQLKLGELTLANRGPIWTEPFAVSHLGEPLQNLAWAGQALFALVREWSGWRGLRLFDALCWIGGFWAVAIACLRRGGRPLAIAIALGLAFTAALPTAILRPQSLASICFGLLLVLLGARMDNRLRVALVTALLLVWQNLHPSVSVGLGVLGVSAAVRWWQWWRVSTQPLPWADTLLVPIAFAAMFATPDGFSILEASARNGEFSLMIGVGEWLPLWAPLNRPVALPIVAVTVLALLAVRRNLARIDLREAAICLALLVMTVLVYRFVLFWAIALIPVIARGALRPVAHGPGTPAAPIMVPAAIAVVTAALLVTAARPVTFRKHIPLAALESLRNDGLSGTIFTDFTLGGAVLHVGYPQWRVAYDGRYYRYTRAEWERFAAIQSGAVGMEAIAARYRPVAWVLEPQRNAALVRELRAHPAQWRQRWADESVVIFVPATIPSQAGVSPRRVPPAR